MLLNIFILFSNVVYVLLLAKDNSSDVYSERKFARFCSSYWFHDSCYTKDTIPYPLVKEMASHNYTIDFNRVVLVPLFTSFSSLIKMMFIFLSRSTTCRCASATNTIVTRIGKRQLEQFVKFARMKTPRAAL